MPEPLFFLALRSVTATLFIYTFVHLYRGLLMLYVPRHRSTCGNFAPFKRNMNKFAFGSIVERAEQLLY